MDFIAFVILGGLVLMGILIGYPTGYAFGQRSMIDRPRRRQRIRRTDILSAEILEEKNNGAH